MNLSGERDPFTVRRPARLVVGFIMIGNPGERSATV